MSCTTSILLEFAVWILLFPKGAWIFLIIQVGYKAFLKKCLYLTSLIVYIISGMLLISSWPCKIKFYRSLYVVLLNLNFLFSFLNLVVWNASLNMQEWFGKMFCWWMKCYMKLFSQSFPWRFSFGLLLLNCFLDGMKFVILINPVWFQAAQITVKHYVASQFSLLLHDISGYSAILVLTIGKDSK